MVRIVHRKRGGTLRGLRMKCEIFILREGRKPGALMNPRVIPTCIAFWPGEKELNLHIKHTTLEPNYNQLFLNLGRVSHECQ